MALVPARLPQFKDFFERIYMYVHTYAGDRTGIVCTIPVGQSAVDEMPTQNIWRTLRALTILPQQLIYDSRASKFFIPLYLNDYINIELTPKRLTHNSSQFSAILQLSEDVEIMNIMCIRYSSQYPDISGQRVATAKSNGGAVCVH